MHTFCLYCYRILNVCLLRYYNVRMQTRWGLHKSCDFFVTLRIKTDGHCSTPVHSKWCYWYQWYVLAAEVVIVCHRCIWNMIAYCNEVTSLRLIRVSHVLNVSLHKQLLFHVIVSFMLSTFIISVSLGLPYCLFMPCYKKGPLIHNMGLSLLLILC